jgi:protein-S-isoprenylcysteine O-methyltransferase Ste14
MRRALALLYGFVCYLVFLYSFLKAVWFVWTMDAPGSSARSGSLGGALLVNAALLGAFAIQHSIMARQWFKRGWSKLVPTPVERSTYVLAASLVLLAVVTFWQPMSGVIWEVETTFWQRVINVLFWIGWLQVLVGTFLIDHFDLFGLKQVWKFFRGETYQPPTFGTPGPYRFVRHPIYLGFVIAFWSTPRMTAGHLLFSVLTTAYILLAIQFEERDLVSIHGEQYRVYRSGVSMLLPWPGKRRKA